MPGRLDPRLISHPKAQSPRQQARAERPFCLPTRSFPGGPPQTFHTQTRGPEPKHRTKCGSETCGSCRRQKVGTCCVAYTRLPSTCNGQTRPPADLVCPRLPTPISPGRGAAARSLVLCIDRLGGLRHELAPTKVKPHLLQYVQECTSQFSGRVSHATLVRRPRARLLAFLLGWCASSFISLQLDGTF